MNPDELIAQLLEDLQAKIDDSFGQLAADPSVRQANSLQRALFNKFEQESDAEANFGPGGEDGEGMPVFGGAPREQANAWEVIKEAMRQNPVGTEEMNPVPRRAPGTMGDITQQKEEDYGLESPTDERYVERNFPRDEERLKTHGWVSTENPQTEHDVTRYEDLRRSGTSREGSMPGSSVPFRLRGPAYPQLDEQTLIQQLLNRFR